MTSYWFIPPHAYMHVYFIDCFYTVFTLLHTKKSTKYVIKCLQEIYRTPLVAREPA